MQRRNDGQGRYGRPAYDPQQDQAWEQQPIYEARPRNLMMMRRLWRSRR